MKKKIFNSPFSNMVYEACKKYGNSFEPCLDIGCGNGDLVDEFTSIGLDA